MNDLARGPTLVEDLRSRVVLLEQRFADHERRHNEFMQRTDTTLQTLLKQSSEWAGARKTLAMLVVVIGMVGSAVGFVIHEVILAGGGGGGR